MSARYRLNRYNWFGQKLLAQHKYREIIKLRECLAPAGESRLNDHMIYLHGLALMKTSTRLDEVIYSLQQLNFEQNNQYFLLLCQCLLYLGNYDSVVALCQRIISKELNSAVATGGDEQQPVAVPSFRRSNEEDQSSRTRLDFMRQDSLEFTKIHATINKNQLINVPKLWYIFGLCLEYQHKYKDAHTAFRIAAKLAGGQTPLSHESASSPLDEQSDAPSTSISNYYTPNIKYAEFCIKHKGDFRSAHRALAEVNQVITQNFTLSSMLALVISVQTTGQRVNFSKANEIMASLELHSTSNMNPSLGYNKLALKCKRRLHPDDLFLESYISDTNDEDQLNLDYLLAKSYITINSLMQSSGATTTTDTEAETNDGSRPEYRVNVNKEVDKLIEALRKSDPTYWTSSSLWNNLGLCYLVKKRFIACLSCLIKAYHLSPLDWRINCNLALAYAHVGLINRALISLHAAKNLYARQLNERFSSLESEAEWLKKGRHGVTSLMKTLFAICYESLGELNESRRLYIETIRPISGNLFSVSIISLVNYLIFLHRNFENADEQNFKVKLHLLDQLEQCWLQRNQSDPQFATNLLDAARQVGELISGGLTRKTYAWTKTALLSGN